MSAPLEKVRTVSLSSAPPPSRIQSRPLPRPIPSTSPSASSFSPSVESRWSANLSEEDPLLKERMTCEGSTTCDSPMRAGRCRGTILQMSVGPFPIANLGLVDSVGQRVVEILANLILQPILDMRAADLHPRHAIDRVDGEGEAVELFSMANSSGVLMLPFSL